VVVNVVKLEVLEDGVQSFEVVVVSTVVQRCLALEVGEYWDVELSSESALYLGVTDSEDLDEHVFFIKQFMEDGIASRKNI